MPVDMMIGVVCGSAISWLVPAFFQKTLGTRYRTENDCQNCALRKSVDEIRTLVMELAIKAGVPANEVANLARRMLQPGKGSSR